MLCFFSFSFSCVCLHISFCILCVVRCCFQVICPIGTYNPSTGQSVCLPCTAGLFCPLTGMTAVPAGNLCALGYYCLPGSSVATQAACPPGFYNPSTGGSSGFACLTCPATFYCPNSAMFGTSGTATSAYTNYVTPAGAFSNGGSSSERQYLCTGGYVSVLPLPQTIH